MKSGAVYIPVDPSLRSARLHAILVDCKPALVLSDVPHALDLDAYISEERLLRLDTIKAAGQTTESRASSEAPCAMVYTFRTTGTPKGLILTHHSMLNNVEGTLTQVDPGSQNVLQQSALTFDMSLWQPLVALASGGTACIVPSEAGVDPGQVSQIIRDAKVTLTVATPSEYAAWMQAGSSRLQASRSWTHAYLGGEAATHDLLRKFAKLELDDLHVVNSYGPAEVCCYSHAIELDYKGVLPERIPLGLPMANYSAYVVGDQVRPLPIGWPGEILIGGVGVGKGYLNQVELTSRSFIPDTFSDDEQKAQGFTTLFRSGDKGRMRADGALLFDGRIDGSTQVKLRGIRIELQDIESCILNAADGCLSNALVTVRDEDIARFLVAHVVSSPDFASDARAALLAQLRGKLSLPTYMKPNMLIELDALPVGRHSKIDRRAVQSLPLPSSASEESPVDLTPRELEVRQLWCDALPEDAVSALAPKPDTDLIAIGGNSLLIVQLHTLLQEYTGKRMPLVDLFDNTTIRSMADLLDMEAAE